MHPYILTYLYTYGHTFILKSICVRMYIHTNTRTRRHIKRTPTQGGQTPPYHRARRARDDFRAKMRTLRPRFEETFANGSIAKQTPIHRS